MEWYVYVAHFCAGSMLVNSVPHFVQGISGNRFQSPFAKPLGVGESSPMVNVLWGMANFAAGYFLVNVLVDDGFRTAGDKIAVLLGGFVTSIGLAWHFGRVRSGQYYASEVPCRQGVDTEEPLRRHRDV